MIPLSFLSQVWRKPGVMRKNGQNRSSKHGYLCSGSFEQDSILMLTKSIFELNFVSPKPNLMTPLSFLSQVWRKPGVMRKNGQDRSSKHRYLCSGSLGQDGIPTPWVGIPEMAPGATSLKGITGIADFPKLGDLGVFGLITDSAFYYG